MSFRKLSDASRKKEEKIKRRRPIEKGKGKKK